MKTMRWTHCVGLAAGAWLLLACTHFGNLTVPFAPMADAVVVAVALIIFATLALVLRLSWNGWATVLIGVWVAAASSIFHATEALVPLLLVGLIGFALCAALLMSESSRRHRQSGRRR